MQYVFVYGTLRAGESNDIHRAAERHGLAQPVLIGAGHAPGRLFDFGAYPGLVPGLAPDTSAPSVRGDVYRIEDAFVPVLDEIEEVVPGVDGLFRPERVHIAVEGQGRVQLVDCLIYSVSGRAVEGLAEIEGGDWVAYRLGRSRSPA
jgi:gamma-glutamylcyclotransferase (GGCT)/AIG2-like uncharacterized protein YtfP